MVAGGHPVEVVPFRLTGAGWRALSQLRWPLIRSAHRLPAKGTIRETKRYETFGYINPP